MSSLDIVKYGERAAHKAAPYIKYSPYAKRAKFTYGAAKYAYDHREAIGKAAKSTYKMYKSRQHAKQKIKTSIGEDIGTTNPKTAQSYFLDVTSRNSNTLYDEDVLNLERGDLLNQRERDLVNLRGWKINMELVNTTASVVYCNVAIIHPKKATAVSSSQFFRSYDTSRNQDFGSTLMNAHMRHCYPINTDQYLILKHKRFRLAPNGQAANQSQEFGSSVHNECLWVPLGRQIRFNGNGSTTNNQKAYLVYWFGQAGTNTLDAANAVCNASFDVSMYYKEPKT